MTSWRRRTTTSCQPRLYSKRRGPVAPQLLGFSATYAYTLWRRMTKFGVVNTCGGGRPRYCILCKCVLRFVSDNDDDDVVTTTYDDDVVTTTWGRRTTTSCQPRLYSKRRGPVAPQFLGFSATNAYTHWRRMIKSGVVNTCGEGRVLGGRPRYCILRKFVVPFVSDNDDDEVVATSWRRRTTTSCQPRLHSKRRGPVAHNVVTTSSYVVVTNGSVQEWTCLFQEARPRRSPITWVFRYLCLHPLT